MSLQDDRFTTLEDPERVFYATGVFLDADDMRAEQVYHRGRLSRVLAYLHGWGTAAGLEVTHDAASDELRVSAGLAIDRLGRLIEVPRTACMRLDLWLEHQRQLLLTPGELDETSLILDALSDDESEVVADVYVRFAVCPRGRTPAFASGPFDALDATVPNRLRDTYEIMLELRGGDDAPLPESPWPVPEAGESVSDWQARLRAATIAAWRHGSESWQDGKIKPDPSTIGAADPTSIFLARVRIPVTVPADPHVPERRAAPVVVDDAARAIVYPTTALMQWLQVVQGP